MPTHASSNPEIKQLYINGHFCYVFKFSIVTNGLGIIRHIAFYNKNFMDSHPDIIVEKKSDSPEEDKCVHDAKLLIPTLKDFFLKHPLINPGTFLGDAAFDSVRLYKELLSVDTFGKEKHFSKAYIPLNAKSRLKNPDYTINENGIPCCPYDDSLPMKSEGTSKLRSGVTRYKFVCPKMKCIYDKSTKKSHRQCFCENPCTTSHNTVVWFIFILQKTFALIPEPFVAPKNGITPTKPELLLKDRSIISKRISVLQDAELKMKKLCMLI